VPTTSPLCAATYCSTADCCASSPKPERPCFWVETPK
jgi:hypothetical protein